MELSRKDISYIIDKIRNYVIKDNELNNLLCIDTEFEGDDLIYGVTNEFLSEFIELLSGNKINVLGEVEKLYTCPCCGYMTLTEKYDVYEGTGYCICPFCRWEDNGTTDIHKYTSLNRGSILDYRNMLNDKKTNKWIKS